MTNKTNVTVYSESAHRHRLSFSWHKYPPSHSSPYGWVGDEGDLIGRNGFIGMCYIDYTSIDLSKASLDDGQWEWIKASITAATTPYVMRDERGYYWCHAEEAAKAMDFVVIALGHKPASSEAEFEKSMANGKKLRYEQFSKTVSEAAAKIGADPEIVWKLLNGGISDVRALFRWAEAEEFTALHFHGK